MKTPKFWAEKSFVSTVLTPLGWLYGAATFLRFKVVKPFRASCPVICVGNLTAGGTGKTPVSLALAQILKSEGKNPFFLTRGYGGKIKNILVDPALHSAEQVGDEPLLLAEAAPVAVNPDRAAGARLACAAGADCLIMDDGFQNPGLYKNLSFLVFDGKYAAGNEKIIPAGPLRESFNGGLARAQALIVIGEDRYKLAQRVNLPVFYADIEEVKPEKCDKGVLAFAGIGHPAKFYDSLQKCGVNVVRTVDFPDHHFYTRSELMHLIEMASEKNLDLFTTSKDYVKIPTDLRHNFRVLPIRIVWQNEEELRKFIGAFV